MLNIVVDLRIDSPTFGQHQEFELSGDDSKVLLISQGLGHSYLSLTDNSRVAYTLTAEYSSEYEFTINPLDKTLSLPWSSSDFIMSDKDRTAISLEQAIDSQLLPTLNEITFK